MVSQPGGMMDAAPANTLALEVDAVRYGYGDLVAVWDVSFQAVAGQLAAIVGRNGAGKTTLMFGLAGLLPTTAGSVKLSGTDIARTPAWGRAALGLALVPEGKRVFRDLSVEDNISVSLPRHIGRSERRTRIGQICERFPILAEKRSQPANTLSGGQQQLLAIGNALAMRPKVLLIDEPSSGLSPVAVDAVYETLTELKNEGMAVVVVEQQIDAVAAVADFIVVIDQGRVVLEGKPQQIAIEELERRVYAT